MESSAIPFSIFESVYIIHVFLLIFISFTVLIPYTILSSHNLHYEKFGDGSVKEIEVPYELPEGWEWSRLGAYMDVRDGTHDTPSYIENGYKFVTSKNLCNNRIDFDNVNFISKEDCMKFNQRSKVNSGDILMAMIGTIGNPVVAPEVEFEYSIKNVALFKRLDDNQNSRFVRDYLEFLEEQLKTSASGGNQKFLSLKKLKDILIPIPPYKEQALITNKLSTYLTYTDRIEAEQNALQEMANQLKKKVLDVAMQGKLVPQDPNDEPASVLLEKIRVEKQNLYEEGKLKKKDLEETTIIKSDDNAYYEKVGNETNIISVSYALPSNWAWVRLNDIITLNIGGGTPSKSNPAYWNGGIPWASVKDIKGRILNNTIDTITAEGLENSSANIVPAGNVVIATRMSLDKVAITGIKTTINQDLRGLFFVNEELRDYFIKFYPELNLKSIGTTVKGISLPVFNTTLIPLPSGNSLSVINQIVTQVDECCIGFQ